MKLRIASDLHFEFHADGGRTLAAELVTGDFDALVVAGDLTNSVGLERAFEVLTDATNKPLIYVPGNHEYYGSSIPEVSKRMEAAAKRFPNLHVLNPEVLKLDGVKFVGTTLWFRKKAGAPTWAMNDFDSIQNFAEVVYELNNEATDFLWHKMEEGCVTITHYLPAEPSVHPKYKGSPLNAFFLCDMESVIKRMKPKLWIHGHTHESADYTIDATRVVCNPFGYARYEENRAFSSTFTVEI